MEGKNRPSFFMANLEPFMKWENWCLDPYKHPNRYGFGIQTESESFLYNFPLMKIQVFMSGHLDG